MRKRIFIFLFVVILLFGFFFLEVFKKDVLQVDIGYQSVTSQTWGALILKNQGIFEEKLKDFYPNRKIKVVWHDEISGSVINTNMISGKIQFGFMGDMPILLNMYKASSLKNYDSRLLALDGRGLDGKNQSILIPKNSKIKDISDLQGKTISTPIGSSVHYMLMKILEKNKLLNQVTIVHQDVALASQLLRSNKTDAFSIWAPYPNFLESKGYAKVLVSGEETHIDYLAGVMVDNDWAKKNQEIVDLFLESLDEAHQFIQENPMKAAKIFSSESGFDIEITKKEIDQIIWDTQMVEKDYETLIDKQKFLIECNQIQKFPLNDFIYERS